MRKVVAAAFASLLISACGGQSPAAAVSEKHGAPVALPTQAIAAPPAAVALIDVPKVAGRTQKEVAELLGEPTSWGTGKQGKKGLFKPGVTEIVFISGTADWITVEALDGAPYSEEVLPLLGIQKTTAVLSNENTIRWETIPGLLAVSVFPAQDGVDYA